MLTTARVNYVRISPRKVRYVIDMVRNQPVPAAYSILDRNTKRACSVVRKLIQQAADSADKLHKTPVESLYVSKIFADGAGMMKRFRAMSMGRAGVIRKRLSHITVELDSRRGVHAGADGKRASAVTQVKESGKPKPAAKGKSSKTAAHKMPAKKLAGAK